MSSAASAAFCSVGAGSTLGVGGTAGSLYGNGKTLKNAVELVCSAAGADNASAVLLGDGTSYFKFLSAGIAGEGVKGHLFLPPLL